jgi:hypothetical protein
MRQVYNVCLYRLRTEAQCLVPDPVRFPRPHQRLQPYIFSEQEVAKLLGAASQWKRVSWSPLRPEGIRLGCSEGASYRRGEEFESARRLRRLTCGCGRGQGPGRQD